jgi:hypothetical protein
VLRSPLRAAPACLATAVLLAGCGDGGVSSETAATTAATGGFGAVEGSWSGTLRQAKTDPFPIEVTVKSQDDPKLNVVHYGGEIDCSGNWSYRGESGSEVTFREVIDRGRGGRCKGVGTVRLQAMGDPDRLDYSFSGGGVSSDGVLSRGG